MPEDYGRYNPEHKHIYRFIRMLFNAAQLTAECAIVTLVSLWSLCYTHPENMAQVTFWVKWVFGSIRRSILAALSWYQYLVHTPPTLLDMIICASDHLTASLEMRLWEISQWLKFPFPLVLDMRCCRNDIADLFFFFICFCFCLWKCFRICQTLYGGSINISRYEK